MKKVVVLAVVLLVSSICVAQEEKSASPWFDMDNCEICKPMAQNKDAMMKIKWETHKIPNGLLSISVVPDDLKPMMEKAHAKMEKTIAKLEGGEKMHLCGFCTSYGSLMGQGAEKTELETVGGKIMMLTSSDPAVVAKIHAHADKTTDAFKKMVTANQQARR